jgi:ligand-binding sensor domain-containing protein/signal transduction histidine kinase
MNSPAANGLIRYLIGLVLIVLSQPYVAQFGSIKFNQINTTDGLSHEFVNTIVKDEIGFMWFGTRAGLNRYDGYEIKVFQHHPSDSTSICANNIQSTYCFENGELWIGTNDGLAQYKSDTESFVNYFPPGIRGDDMVVNCLDEDKDGNLWVGTSIGLFVKRITDEVLSPISSLHPSLSKLDSTEILDFFFDSSYIFIGTFNEGLWQVDLPTNELTTWSKMSEGWRKLNSNKVSHVIRDSKGELLVGYVNGIIERRNLTDQSLFVYTGLQNYVRGDMQNQLADLCLDSEGTMWASSSLSGLSYLDKKTDSFVHLKDMPGIIAFDNTRSARCIYVDKNGTIWLAMHTTGVVFFNLLQQTFVNYGRPDGVSDSEIETSLLSNWTRAFAEDDQDRLWIGTADGVSILDRSTQQFISLHNKTKTDEVLANNSIRSLLNIADQFMLIGSAGGITKYDFKSGKSTNFYPDYENTFGLCGAFVYDMKQSQTGEIYISTSRGFCRYDDETQRFYNWHEHPEVAQLLKLSTRGIVIDEENVVWIAISNGDIVEFHPQTLKIVKHIGLFSKPEDAHNTTLDMLNDDSLIWVGTMNGLIKFNKISKQFSLMEFGGGVIPGIVGNLWKDSSGVLWFTGTTGLVRYNTSTGVVEYLDVHHGLPTNSFHFQHAFKTYDGFLCMASLKGLVIFNPENVQQLIYHPKAILTGLRILNESVPLSAIHDNVLTLNHDQNFLTFTLNTFEYLQKDNIRYAYMLEGLHEDWVYNDKNRQISFTNLPGGDYTLKFKTSTADGVWTNDYQTLKIHIRTVYYKTWWFISGLALLLIGVVYSVVRYRQNQRLKVELLRQKIASDLHDDIGSTLSSIKMYSEIAIGNDEASNPLLRKISDNAGLIVDSMSDMVWAIKPGNEKLGDLRSKMEGFALEMCGPLEVDLAFYFDPSLEEVKVNMEYKKDIYLVFKESLNNAIKYSQCSKIAVNVKREQQHLILEVTDNGVGFDVTTIQKGNGLDNMKMRIAKLKGEMTIHSRKGEGTVVQCKVRLNPYWVIVNTHSMSLFAN